VVAQWTLYDGGKAKARRDEALALAGELLQRVEDLKKSARCHPWRGRPRPMPHARGCGAT